MSRTLAVALLLATAALASPSTAPAAFKARGSVEQVHVTGARPGTMLALADRRGLVRRSQRAGKLGAAVFRNVKPGRYRVRGERVRVLSTRSAPPSTTGYRQRIPESGYGYLTTRDGTRLAINVHLPSGPGPYPTLVEYSGYGYANPDGGGELDRAIANLLGYAVVDVNMRGTGCSGGAFDYFEPLQGLDGYDVVETVARQPWVARGKVGMVGLSYGGISQLFVAATRPPSLAAITPLSVIDNTQTTLYPGGILNTGFALSWAKDRVHDAQAGVGDRRPGVGAQAHPRRRPDLQGQPGAARRGGRPAREGAGERPLRPEGRRSAVARDVRGQDPGARVPRVPVDRRADGRALPDAAPALHRHAPQVVHVHQRHAHRLARPRDVRALVRLPRALRRAPAPAARARCPRRRPGDLQHRDGRAGPHAARRPDPGPAELRGGAGGLRGAAAGADPVRQRRRQRDAGRARPRVRALVRALPAARYARAVVVPRRRRGARRRARRPRRAPTGSRGAAPRGRRRTSAATRRVARTGCGWRRPHTAGRSIRRARRCPM